MTDPALLLTLAAAAIGGIAILAAAGLKGWTGWLELQRASLSRGDTPPATSPAARIELADLRERVRKLEAIAAGVDL